MRGITLGVFSAQSIYDVDFQTNVLDVAQTMGYAIPPLEKRLLLNRLMVDMKNIGFFQIQDTLSNFALGITGFEQFRMIDWKKTGNVYTPYGGLIYNTDGIKGNGTDAFLSTNYNPTTTGVNYTLDNAGIVVVNSTRGSAGLGTVIGTNLDSGVVLRNRIDGQRLNRIYNLYIDLNQLGFSNINRFNTTAWGANNGLYTYINETPPALSIPNEPILIHKSTNGFGDSLVNMCALGSSMPNTIFQSFRTIYNQFLSDSGLSPIA